MQQSSPGKQAGDESPADNNVGTSVPQDDSPRQDADLVARRAYQRYEERGREDGHDVDDWLSAEHEVGGTMSDGQIPRDRSDER
jgi:hypothetical protein